MKQNRNQRNFPTKMSGAFSHILDGRFDGNSGWVNAPRLSTLAGGAGIGNEIIQKFTKQEF